MTYQNPLTTISYSIVESGKVSLKVYDILGKEVAVLVNESKMPGEYTIKFSASNLSSGVYFYTLKVNDFLTSRKMLLIK